LRQTLIGASSAAGTPWPPLQRCPGARGWPMACSGCRWPSWRCRCTCCCPTTTRV